MLIKAFIIPVGICQSLLYLNVFPGQTAADHLKHTFSVTEVLYIKH